MTQKVLLGDEALAQAAVDAGISAAYGYPGTPSTEILEYLIPLAQKTGDFVASWCTNEKTAFEDALGTSLVGRRALVTMKHVGLNVAADAFINAALLDIQGGLVLAVADDPGMHSSQNEQDSRFFADFAFVPCFEPRTQQEIYDMTLAAFDFSEAHHLPVMIRLVTRLAHSRMVVNMGERRAQNPVKKMPDKNGWMLLPALARRNYKKLLAKQTEFKRHSETSGLNVFTQGGGPYAVITTGLGANYFNEVKAELDFSPAHLHIAFYPPPASMIKTLSQQANEILVIEEGMPFLEKQLNGILGKAIVKGKLSGALPVDGELNPDLVRAALGLPLPKGANVPTVQLPGRPPQLCPGCPHQDSYEVIKEVLAGYPQSLVTSDIGCYALGALPPLSVPETIVCMGASVGMAKGASEAGFHPVVAVIGDSTFLHSGLTSLLDCVDADSNITIVIVDNETVAMTGGQKTIVPSSRLAKVIEGAGVPSARIHIWDAHKRSAEANKKSLKEAIDRKGLDVVISIRECIETLKRKPKAGGQE